ncbi:biotin transporter BioY [Sphaerisporangium sp. NPDC088356]|uniref:biotin transporter BioY n=1 Tax=Sphaerisporangium sp. NPDC088356 TaxID=3154871 RepID=UPI0034220A8C
MTGSRTSMALPAPSHLVDLLPGDRARDVGIVLSGAVLTGLAAQVAMPLPFTPVPLTLQTLAVLLVGAVTGPVRALLSMGVYVAAGLAGVPWFAGGASGTGGATFGYVVGFVVAAGVVGWLSQGARTRSPLRMAALMLLGNLVIYAIGVPWLALASGASIGTAASLGLLPFVAGDLVKTAAAAALLPVAWRLAHRR